MDAEQSDPVKEKVAAEFADEVEALIARMIREAQAPLIERLAELERRVKTLEEQARP